MPEVSFTATPAERQAVTRIATRFIELCGDYAPERLQIEMDLIAAHANGNLIDFPKLEGFDDFNLLHDVGGISRHIDRATGKLGNCFSPRSSRREQVSA